MDISDITRQCGGVTALARHLGLHHTTVLGWRTVPPRHAQGISALTGIPLHELRPDIFPHPDAHPRARPQEAA